MSDVISRQAAIDALKEEEYPCESDYDEGYMAALDKAVWIIEKWLPSAQPELPIKEKCCYCPHCTNCDVNDDLTINQPEPIKLHLDHALTEEEIKNLKQKITDSPIVLMPSAQPERRWIPCSERLPKVGQDILMSVGGMYTAEGCLREDGNWAQFRWDTIQRKDMVGAWMPLPEPYKENSDGH